eukprot:UN24012
MFSLASNEVLAREEPPPLFLLCSRQSYFPNFGDKLRDHFSSFAAAREDGLWFEFKKIPIQWQYTVGVLYDIFGTPNIPWNITVHFQGYPDKVLVRHTKDSLLQTFMQSLKQAVMLWFGSVSYIMNLTEDQTSKLWEATQERNSYTTYDNIYNKLLTNEDQSIPTSFPLRIFLWF